MEKQLRNAGDAALRRDSVFLRLRTFGWLKLIGLMFGLGIVLMFTSIHWIPEMKRWGVPPAMADRLPFAALACGMAWGFAVAIYEEPKLVLQGLCGMLGVGILFWFGGVFAGGLLVGAGLSEAKAAWIPLIAFYLGLFTGLLGILVLVAESLNMPRVTEMLIKAMALPLVLVVLAYVGFEFAVGALFALAFIDVILIAAGIALLILGLIAVIGKLIDLFMSQRTEHAMRTRRTKRSKFTPP